MPRTPAPRSGSIVLVRKRPVNFSLWPMYRTTRRFGLQSMLFVLDPWIVIEDSIRKAVPAASRDAALAFFEQARDFFNSAMVAKISAARPLQLYYSFLNLTKAFVLVRGTRNEMDRGQHGLSERLSNTPGAKEFVDAYLEAYRSPNSKGEPNSFDEFLKALSGVGIPRAQTTYKPTNLLPQILTGHRVWASAAKTSERFISIHELRFLHDAASKRIWLSLYFFGDDLTRLGVSHGRLLADSRLANLFEEVTCKEKVGDRKLICFQEVAGHVYTHRPADAIATVVTAVKPFLWETINSSPPYRRYYVYLSPAAERPEVLPQIASIYAMMYYLGSIVRYRPHHFRKIIEGAYGPRVEEFISGIPAQFLYLLASEFARREITKPSIV
jgi:hypothetical protein